MSTLNGAVTPDGLTLAMIFQATRVVFALTQLTIDLYPGQHVTAINLPVLVSRFGSHHKSKSARSQFRRRIKRRNKNARNNLEIVRAWLPSTEGVNESRYLDIWILQFNISFDAFPLFVSTFPRTNRAVVRSTGLCRVLRNWSVSKVAENVIFATTEKRKDDCIVMRECDFGI